MKGSSGITGQDISQSERLGVNTTFMDYIMFTFVQTLCCKSFFAFVCFPDLHRGACGETMDSQSGTQCVSHDRGYIFHLS